MRINVVVVVVVVVATLNTNALFTLPVGNMYETVHSEDEVDTSSEVKEGERSRSPCYN